MSILDIIFTTPHGYGTHYATVQAKYFLRNWVRSKSSYLTYQESADIKNGQVTLQFLIDLASIILLAHSIDPWKEMQS